MTESTKPPKPQADKKRAGLAPLGTHVQRNRGDGGGVGVGVISTQQVKEKKQGKHAELQP